MSSRRTQPANDEPPILERTGPGPFRIHVVAELTGVPEPTLRAWERRYGIPRPERTSSGYRLYGVREVDEVRRMKELCDQGMAAAEAAAHVRARSGDEEHDAGASASAGDDPFLVLAEEIVGATRAYNDVALDRALARLPLLGPGTVLLDRVLVPALRRIGELWAAGELSVAQEHFAAQRIDGFLRSLLSISTAPEADRRVLLASFAEDDHELGLLGTALRVASWGYKPLVLGARTPPSALRAGIEGLQPDLVALSVTVAPPRPRARELVDDYASACGDIPWIVGGAGAGDLVDLVEGRGGKIDPGDSAVLRALVRELLATPPPAARRDPKPPRRKT
jgi:DNA-binding transcriptional MerR regulator